MSPPVNKLMASTIAVAFHFAQACFRLNTANYSVVSEWFSVWRRTIFGEGFNLFIVLNASGKLLGFSIKMKSL